MAPRSGPLLPLVVAAPPQQKVAGLECYGDTGVRSAQEGAPLPAAHGAAGYSSSDAPPQIEPRGGPDSAGLDMCGKEECPETPGPREKKVWVALHTASDLSMQSQL